ncbi:hypothetical protein HOI26_02040 [Candidatus Woesearchaeota archaeon]|jgi:hypothetical protein|nr:hypothetical protein [Candidatus Woesearchaeota archaeon]MBT5739858.1 hypothetical protein [Candidatus Woesearchaeota archaeon]
MATYAKGRRRLRNRILNEMQHGNRELQYVNKALEELPNLQNEIKSITQTNVISKRNKIVRILQTLMKELERAVKELPKNSSLRLKLEVEQGKWQQLILITKKDLSMRNRDYLDEYMNNNGTYLAEYQEALKSLKEYLIADIALSQQFLAQQEALDKTA